MNIAKSFINLAMLWSRGLEEGMCIWCTITVDGLTCFQNLLSPKEKLESQHPNRSVCDETASYDYMH